MIISTNTAAPAPLPSTLMPSPPVNKWLVAASVSCGSMMGVLDSTIVNVALPQIQGAVGATLQQITWVATGYTIAAVLLMPLVAFLGRRFGQKRVYMLCLGLFLLGSALCGLSRTLPQLIAFRVLQGLGGGAMQPTEEAILRQTFPKSEQGMAMALTGMMMMIGPALGPLLGGYIVDHLHWSWIFFVSLPIGLLGLVMTGTFVREDPEILAENRARAAAERTNVDWSGIGLLSTCLATTEFVIEEGQRRYWFDDSLIRVFTFVAIATFAAFVARQLTAKAPVMNLRLLKDSRFAIGMLLSVLVMCTLMATMFLLSVFMQQARGFTAFQAGLATLPMVLGMFVVMPIAGAIYERVPPRLMMAGGVLLLASGAYELSQVTLAVGQWGLALPLVMQGAGMALIFVPMETTAFSRIPRHLTADATGLSNVLKETGGAIGLALFTSVLLRREVVARAGLAAHLGLTNPLVAQRLSLLQALTPGLSPAAARSQALGSLSAIVSREAAVRAYNQLFLLLGAMILILLPLVFLLKVDPSAIAHAEPEAE
ncbi:MAG: DHA2 family efflux MFS transporter permease subunit [Pseudomonadota bacterium]